MKTIFKYPLRPGTNAIDMPTGARILSVQTQHDEPQLWALVEPGGSVESRTVVIVGTGHSIDFDPSHYVGTFQMHGGALVWHVFEVK